MIGKSCFSALTSCIENSICIDVEEVVIAAIGVHGDHPMFTFLGRDEFAAILQNKRVWFKVS
jgi:hypothetical protein